MNNLISNPNKTPLNQGSRLKKEDFNSMLVKIKNGTWDVGKTKTNKNALTGL
ncbi:hypothetical protein [Flavivirga eckloniae]|uniref:hypothetical protein n=1 Tax=Flavivirga eckloniae TaxID=1803846 RepID=UPI0013157C27|nr:hypothetical protein [Flavivirga eckloniae]